MPAFAGVAVLAEGLVSGVAQRDPGGRLEGDAHIARKTAVPEPVQGPGAQDLGLLELCYVRGKCAVCINGRWQTFFVDSEYLHSSIVYRQTIWGELARAAVKGRGSRLVHELMTANARRSTVM